MPTIVGSISASASIAPSSAPQSSLSPTAAFKESAAVGRTMRTMAEECQDGAASSVMFLPAKGTKYKAWAFAYHTSLLKQMNLIAAPAGGKVRGTIVINPSGHVGEDSLKEFAKTNSYNVRVALPNGQTLSLTDVPRNDPSGEEYATKIPIEFPYMSGVTRIEAWPTGSAMSGGYSEGRVYEVHSADKPFDIKASEARAEQYEAQYPSVRWGSDNEDDDLEKLHISPSPRPFKE